MSVDQGQGWGQGRPPPGGTADYGPPGMQGKPRVRLPSNTGVLVAILGGGGFLAILIVIAILVASGVLSSDDRVSATDRLAAAAQRLTGVRAVGLRGTVSSGSDKLEGDLKVTRGGRMTGTVTWSGQHIKLITVNGEMYVKGSAGFWRSEGDVTSKSKWINNGRWGKLGPTTIDTTIRKHLTPEAIARKLREVSRYTVKSTAWTSVRDNPALKISTATDSFYVSTEDSPRLLRLETTYPEVTVDVTESTGSDGGEAVIELRARIKQLKGSFDPSQRTRVTKLGWGSCTTSGCTVHSNVWATRGDTSSTRVTVFVRLTAGGKSGRKLGECSASGTVTSNDSIRLTCRVTGKAWSSFRNGSGLRRWWGHAEAMAGGATDSDIRTMLSGLDSE